jgi:formiminoglutamate deiminase
VTTGAAVWCEWALLPDGVAPGVLVEIGPDGRITGVQSGAEPARGVRRRAGVTIPGAANAHSHAFHRALRHHSQRARGTFWTWRTQMYAVAARLDPDRQHRLARAVFAEMTLAGYACVGEFHYVHHRPDGTSYADATAMGDAVVAAAHDAGLRVTLLDTVYLRGGLGPGGHLAIEDGQRRFTDGTVGRWVERVERYRLPAHARLGAAIHSVRAVDPGAIAETAAWAASRRAPLHAHLSEQPAENEQCQAAYGCTPTELLASVLGPRFTAVHATHLTDHDLGLLGASGSTVCLCPTTERDLGDGVGPARVMLDHGIALAIGSDSHAVVDPFEEVRAIELDERLVRCARGVLDTGELLGVLGAGHRSLGWDDAGTIATGNRADLVTVRLDSPRTAGATHGPGAGSIAEAIVFAAAAADVTDVTIDGVDVVVDGRHTAIDVAAELDASIRDVVGKDDEVMR